MAYIEPSSPVNPDHAGEFLSREWEQRQLNVETRFDIFGEFREKAPVKWALRQFKKRNLMPLLQQENDFFYAPFVFYKNLKFDTEIPAYLSSTILGQEVYVSITEIADAIKCPCDDQHARLDEYP
jgi:predicted CoA-binding protein